MAKPSRYKRVQKLPDNAIHAPDYSKSMGNSITWAYTTYLRAKEKGIWPAKVTPFELITYLHKNYVTNERTN